MKLGILDIGAVNAQLQVIEVGSGPQLRTVSRYRLPTGLSTEIRRDGSISRTGVSKVASAARGGVRQAARCDIDSLVTFVTSSVRDAPNQHEVIASIAKASGVKPTYFSGEQEARLTYLAAREWFGDCTGPLLVLDIGGGTMELAYGTDGSPQRALSVRLGARHVAQMLVKSDRPTSKELKRLTRVCEIRAEPHHRPAPGGVAAGGSHLEDLQAARDRRS